VFSSAASLNNFTYGELPLTEPTIFKLLRKSLSDVFLEVIELSRQRSAKFDSHPENKIREIHQHKLNMTQDMEQLLTHTLSMVNELYASRPSLFAIWTFSRVSRVEPTGRTGKKNLAE